MNCPRCHENDYVTVKMEAEKLSREILYCCNECDAEFVQKLNQHGAPVGGLRLIDGMEHRRVGSIEAGIDGDLGDS